MFHMPSFPEMLVIMVIGLLLFGKRLPEVGKSLGKGIVEFKKGLKGIEDDVDLSTTTSNPPMQTRLPEQPTQPQISQQPVSQTAAPAHKFDPYTGKPLETSKSVDQATSV